MSLAFVWWNSFIKVIISQSWNRSIFKKRIVHRGIVLWSQADSYRLSRVPFSLNSVIIQSWTSGYEREHIAGARVGKSCCYADFDWLRKIGYLDALPLVAVESQTNHRWRDKLGTHVPDKRVLVPGDELKRKETKEANNALSLASNYTKISI